MRRGCRRVEKILIMNQAAGGIRGHFFCLSEREWEKVGGERVGETSEEEGLKSDGSNLMLTII